MWILILIVIIWIGVIYYITKPKKIKANPMWLDEYDAIYQKNHQDILELEKEEYIKEYYQSISIDNEREFGGITLIKNNSIKFLEELLPTSWITSQDELLPTHSITINEDIRKPLKLEIKFDDIKYYEKVGEVENRQEITGTGGGSSLGGAVLGGVIAGSTGAIIGSRKGINVKTNYTKIDTRELIIKTNNNKTYKFDNIQIYDDLFSLIPEKEYSVYKAKLTETNNTQTSNNDDIGQLEKLAELKDKGIITEEEFEESKKKILSKI